MGEGVKKEGTEGSMKDKMRSEEQRVGRSQRDLYISLIFYCETSKCRTETIGEAAEI